MTQIPNIIVFGESGAGKSSLINMIADKEVAKIGGGATDATLESTCYQVSFSGSTWNVWDTAGLNETEEGAVSNLDAIVQLYKLIKSLTDGISLLIFCYRGPRMRDTAHKYWRLFCEVICQRQVPIVLAITGLEQEQNMDDWWVNNKDIFQKFAISPNGVACVTATRGKKQLNHGTVNQGFGYQQSVAHTSYLYEGEYKESMQKMRHSIRMHHHATPWTMTPIEWFRSIVEVTWEPRFFGLWMTKEETERTVTGKGVAQLIKQCHMTKEEAESLAKVLSDA